MAEQSVLAYNCPECGGSMVFNPSKGKMQCEYCDSLFTREEVEKYFAEKEQKMADRDAGKDWGEEESSMKGYNCSSCGAELIADQNTAVIRCPYCGNQTIAPTQFTGALKPDYVVPFAFDKKAAIEKYKEYYNKRFLLPKDFTVSSKIEEIQGVYVPFWLFNGTVDAEGKYEAYDSKTEGDYVIRDFYDSERAGKMGFTNVPADASVRMQDSLMDSIEPYNFDALETFTTAYLPGFLAEKFDVKEDDDRKRAEKRIEETVKDKLHDTIDHSGFDVKDEKVNIHFNETRYALLPVWMLTTNWNGKSWTFAMNGQTGKFTGDLPVSGLKLGLLSAVTFIATFIIGSMIIG